ncbi:MAG: hypothetical protein JNN15_18705, partial [Blastocatellia bacterium]|nr:hypothetical protein [Blastocatellia bacterium]
MISIANIIAQELSLKLDHVENVLQMFSEGSTVPFIARYRKERTGTMTEVVLREVYDRNLYLNELEERKIV